MKIVFASDSFKGSLSSEKINQLLGRAAREVFGSPEVVPVVLADGGEGTLAAVLALKKGRKIAVTVHDPLMNETEAYYGSFDDGKAVIEMAQASGLTLIPEGKRNPLKTSSIGTGELIRAALKAGHRELVIGIGGSATNDGGMGAAAALGIRFLDKKGKALEGRGEELINVTSIYMPDRISELNDAKISVMCDVTNPLCGPMGASRVFGPQKGADEVTVKALEEGMENYRDVIRHTFGVDPDKVPGAGAAGGMGAALKIMLGGELRSGIDTLLDLCDFGRLISGADLIITGEGRLDSQSASGKAVQGVGLRAKRAGIPCIAICGCTGEGFEKIKECGVTKVVTLTDNNITPEQAMERAEEIYYKRAVQVLRSVGTKEME
ncbi:MAG: glycerate kinase [Lachnospiraceae bacterium]|nr:glycerate kinase [Lachnospiraceae bacterium]